METPPFRIDGKAKVGRPYFDFDAPLADGGRLRLSSLVGRKAILLQFWGVRCKPCLAEMEFLADLHARLGGRGLQIVGVNTDRADPAQLAEVMRTRGIRPPYPVVLDPDAAISQHYTDWLIPVTVLIGRDGVVRAIHTGYRDELQRVIESEILESL
jgi:peroxiredoxin